MRPLAPRKKMTKAEPAMPPDTTRMVYCTQAHTLRASHGNPETSCQAPCSLSNSAGVVARELQGGMLKTGTC